MGTRVLVIDNYDSFVYNLVQELGELGADPVVHRNDAIDVDGIRAAAPDAILISPGPGRPESAGISMAVIRELAGEIPILGVCLGHQAIGQVYGGEVVAAPRRSCTARPRPSTTTGRGCSPASPTPSSPPATTPWWWSRLSVPDVLEVTARTADGVIMGLRHRTLAVEGRPVPPRVAAHPGGARRSCRTSWPPPGAV